MKGIAFHVDVGLFEVDHVAPDLSVLLANINDILSFIWFLNIGALVFIACLKCIVHFEFLVMVRYNM